MGRDNTVQVSSDGLSVVAAMAAASGGLRTAILTLAECHGGKPGPWLDQLEADLVRDTKNMVINGAAMEAEAAAVRYALENLTAVMGNVRRRLEGSQT